VIASADSSTNTRLSQHHTELMHPTRASDARRRMPRPPRRTRPRIPPGRVKPSLRTRQGAETRCAPGEISDLQPDAIVGTPQSVLRSNQ
jgi:hypothetical protein